MRDTDYFKGKKITIVGLARSGLACANLLHSLGSEVSVTDNQDNELTRSNSHKLSSKEIKVELGKHSEEWVKKADLMVISPGVANTSLPVIWAKHFNIPIISEVEAAWILCPATVIAVTGTNGKTTVTTLIGKILEANGKRAFVCGNIGNPFCGEVEKMREGDFVSLEISSFQLERTQTFKPKIALILNFSPNHLDRYDSLDDYLKAKKRIFMNQDPADYLVLNFDDHTVRDLAREARSKVIFFYKHQDLNPNQSAALAVASILDIGREAVSNVFKDFKGVEHRLEQVGQINNITFVNDSKATTVDAAIWALKNISSPVILIAGGREKGNDYSAIFDLLCAKAKRLVLIGEAKKKIEEAFKGHLAIEEAGSLDEAVKCAFSHAKPGDCVLLSPMCKSFDMFSDYEERGRVFKKAVSDLIKGKNGT